MLRGAKRDKLDPALDAFDVETARQLVLPLALALDYLHHKVRNTCRGCKPFLSPVAHTFNANMPTQLVVHLDVKLDNVMIKLAPPEDGPGPMGRERAILRDPESGRLVVKVRGVVVKVCCLCLEERMH